MSVVVTLGRDAGRPPEGVERWLYAGDDAAERAAVARRIGAALPEVATGDARADAARRLRTPYLDAIGELSARNAGPEWWATHLAAKQPYPSLFTRLCALAAAADVLSDGTLVVCGTPALAGEIGALARARGLTVQRAGPDTDVRARAGSLARRASPLALRAGWPLLRAWGDHAPARLRPLPARLPGGRFALDRAPGHRRRTLAELGAGRAELAGPGTALLVTWVDARSFDEDGAYRDPHLGPLAGLLRVRGLRTAILPRILPTADFAATAAALARSGEPALLPDAWLTAQDWRACERRAARYAPAIPDDLHAGGVPLAALAREYLAEHRRAHADALSYDALVARLDAGGIRPERVILPWEGHAWEAALTGAVHRRWPGTRLIGYDNVNFTSLALSLYPAAAELGTRPLPDRVVTNGPAFAEVLRDQGFPAERIRTGCALRHGSLWSAPAAQPREPGTPLRVLVAGTIDPAQTNELVATAAQAFADDPDVDVRVKLHPACDRSAVRPLLAFDPTPIGEALIAADLMLYTYSVVAYEALAAAVPPVFVRSEVFLDLDQLEPFSDLRWRARGAAELREAAAKIRALRGAARAEWAGRARAAARAALAPCGEDAAAPFLDA